MSQLPERDVRKADRELKSQLSKLQGSQTQVDLLQKKYSDLLSDMKRLEREHVKSKKRADQLQKEKDSSRSELSKMTTVKEKLEKLCRELQKENKKVKVRSHSQDTNASSSLTSASRTRIDDWARPKVGCAKSFMSASKA